MSEPRTASAIASPRAWAVLLVVLILGLASDLVSKNLAFRHIAGHPVVFDRSEVLAAHDPNRELIPRHRPVTVVPRVLDFTLVLNQGAVFGMGAGKRWLFIAFTGGAIALGLWMFGAWTKPRDWVAHVSLGLLLAGGLGNLYDRLVYACVRDFIHPLPGVTVGSWEVWPYVSNVADALLIVGIAGLMYHLWKADKPGPVAEAEITG